jgi:hypothetical protein
VPPRVAARRENEHTAATRRAISVVLVAAIAASAAAGCRADGTRSHPSSSAVVLGRFLLRPSGILFELHPTEARITLVVAAEAPLKVCQLGTTFSTHWKGGCRRMAERPLALPTSGGAVHIGFRVLPSNGRATRVMALRVRWHCVDHYFALMRGKTEVRSTSPVFDY